MKPDELNEVIVGLDPGKQGGAAILFDDDVAAVYDVPTIKTKKKSGKKEKNTTEFDLLGMHNIFSPFINVVQKYCSIEKVGAMPGEGRTSTFNFGKGVGYWEMAATACGFTISEIRPKSWKEHYPVFKTDPQIADYNDSLKALRAQKKSTKDKELKNRIEKEISSINRKLKERAKDVSREVASELFPDIADCFNRKKDDGKSDALLIAKYHRDSMR
jgi:crossover junction endodeoxyribonuclease RuvC